MSRREEVEKEIEYMLDSPAHQIEECCEQLMSRARTLADEVDAITAERDKANRFDATAQSLSEIVDDQKRDKDNLRNSLDRATSERDIAQAECKHLNSIIAAMGPVGFELDVTADELAPLYWRARGTKDNIREFDQLCEDDRRLILNGLAFCIDLCRSRIRPVYECKECAKKEAEIDRVRNWNVNLNTTVEAVRAALENGGNE